MTRIAPSYETTANQKVPANFYRGGRFTWHQRRRHAMVRRLMKGLEGKRVLDYGCGYGDLTYAMSKMNSVVGIDIDPGRVAFARSQYPKLEFHEFDGEAAPFADGSFDVVMSCVVLPFVRDYMVHIQDIRRLLRPGGFVLLATATLPAVRGWTRRVLGRPMFSASLHLLKPLELHRELESAGFTIERSDYFYDPPLVGWTSTQDAIFGAANQLLSLSHIGATAPYYAYCARKVRD